ncbi:MAG: molybdenum ABC transporter ATP-binding protein [Hydrogenophilales bacterium 16-64-46]|nr:MAG: molybdenum ABC transporter ATP-binding protein [Hydrogenophilales bacterium 12-64-13]OYZ07164.1 MAG: molybdenum ABC transporter ATP-binding protein [Hydrogenophilales bacterium 16-64-46]OZA37367.1 MAG: molybdenum ABC transporter ATP-binding protein [Hydrogenophilales bacterium 17-64-34]HQT00615.1 molybdenum ABC transporter ATP-binding protein [Thiobacillus sp.]
MSCLHLSVDWSRGAFSLKLDLDLPARGVTALFGHSGSGKTTLLRLIAGLDRAPARIAIGDEVWQDTQHFLPPHRRPIGFVFQDAALFPHLSARANIDFGRRRTRTGMNDTELDHLVDLLGIAPLLERKPAALSGGEAQRVAIARALALKPRVLLMDEPLAALDDRRRAEILPYLDALHGELAIPLVYVTHSTDEVARLADHLVVLDAGRVVWQGDVAAGLAAHGVRHLMARVVAADAAGCQVDVAGQRLDLPGVHAAVGERFALRLSREAQSSENK